MNKLIYYIGATLFGRIAVLETPCYPAVYYAGYVQDKDLTPCLNDTYLWHYTKEEARTAAIEQYHHDLSRTNTQ